MPRNGSCSIRISVPTIEKHRRRHIFARGYGLASALIYHNFVVGCTIVMKRARAVSYLPFPTTVVHDHYLAFRAASDGAIDYLDTPQISYRIYGGNQTGVMQHVKTKHDYKVQRIDAFASRLQAFGQSATLPALSEATAWGLARIENFHRKRGGMRKLYRLRQLNPATTWFELIVCRLPAPLFRFAVGLIRRGWL